MMTVKAKQFKVGDKVRILNVDKIAGAEDYFKSGDTTHVMYVDNSGCPYLYCNDGDYDDGLFAIGRELEYIELIADKPSYPERISLLESQVADLTAKVEALEKARKPKYTLDELLADIPTPNQQRKAVIERAKEFVAEYSPIVRLGKSELSNHNGDVRIDFVVNAEKRTVVAIPRLAHVGSIITYAKAIAKCAPDDVFNADIGKAIALGRALGLDVSEFENAVKPTELVPGMRVIDIRKGSLTVEEVRPQGYLDYDEGYTHNYGWSYIDNATIIDDTDAKY